MEYSLFQLHDYVDEKYPAYALEVATRRDAVTCRVSRGTLSVSFMIHRVKAESALVKIIEIEIDNSVMSIEGVTTSELAKGRGDG